MKTHNETGVHGDTLHVRPGALVELAREEDRRELGLRVADPAACVELAVHVLE